jgi:hypothetical protein
VFAVPTPGGCVRVMVGKMVVVTQSDGDSATCCVRAPLIKMGKRN